MNSKPNCTLFIIMALLGSVKNSYTGKLPKQLATTHVKKPIKEVKTFESRNYFAVLSALDSESKLGHMNNEPADSGLLSDESSASPRPFQENRRKKKRSSLNISAEETPIIKTNGSRLGMPSVEGISKRLARLLILGFLNGVQGIPEQCQNNSTLLSCYKSGCDDAYNQSQQLYNDGYSESLIVGYISWGCVSGGILLLLGRCCYKYCKSLKEKIENERRTQVDNA